MYCPHCGRELGETIAAAVGMESQPATGPAPQPIPGQTQIDPKDPMRAFLGIPAEEIEEPEENRYDDSSASPLIEGEHRE